MLHNDIFPLLIVNARPGAGKSELVRALGQVPLEERIARFHIGRMHVIDDFPMLWTWFEEDRILEEVFERPRLHTTPDEYFVHHDLWHLLIRRMCLAFEKFDRDTKEPHSVILEFSRGVEHGGYQVAYQHLSPAVLERAVSLYIRVSYEESMRKNRVRFNPARPDSVLQHGLSAEKLDRLYREDDWDTFTSGDASYIQLGTTRIPYTVFENEDDVTTPAGELMFTRLEACTERLWKLRQL